MLDCDDSDARTGRWSLGKSGYNYAVESRSPPGRDRTTPAGLDVGGRMMVPTWRGRVDATAAAAVDYDRKKG